MEFSPFKNAGFVSAEIAPSQLAKEVLSDDVQTEFLSRGVFFDVYAIQNERKETRPYVLKDFRSGDKLRTPQEQVALFQYQYYEWTLLKKELGDEFFPESHWIRSASFTEGEAHAYFAKPGVTPNTYVEVAKTQLDRQLGDRYGRDDAKKGKLKRLMSALGKIHAQPKDEKPFIGAVIQERIQGIPFSEALKRMDKKKPSYALLRKNIKDLISGLRRFHADNETSAFTWHGLESDNVVAQVDEKGELTGKVIILDGNFTERPSAIYRSKVLKKISQNVFAKLEEAFAA
ncbi:MAG: hypothetical protein WC641_06540 [Patescibacteria group bacterium]